MLMYIFTLFQDRLDGYMMQNKLLNNEILELSKLRHLDAKKMQSLLDKVSKSFECKC